MWGYAIFATNANLPRSMIERIIFTEDYIKALCDTIVARVEPIGPSRASVLRATGMSLIELDSFLNANQIEHSGSRLGANAMPKLKEWYEGKMRRYVRNALNQELSVGDEDYIIFSQFCDKYLKDGIYEIKSWDDIDVNRLLMDFEGECYASYHCSPIEGSLENLFSKIHRSFLFHLGSNKLHKHRLIQVNRIISIILTHHYHIFTTEGDAYADIPKILAKWPVCKRFNPPRHAILYGLAS